MKQIKKNSHSSLNNKGVALLTVLVSILIMSLLTIEFQYSVAIERKLAYSDLNQLQAHYLAKSGARFGLLRIVLFLKANKKFEGNETIRQKLTTIWSLPLPPFPPATSTIKKLAKADQDAAEKAVEETKISVGQFSQTITSESSKINLNSLMLTDKDLQRGDLSIDFASAAPPKGLYEYIARLLYNSVREIFQKSDNPIDEFGTSRADDVVFDIMDWVNKDSVAFGNKNKDAFYDQQKPPYKAKRGRFFTVDELKLVRSIDENLFRKLKPLVTVYSYDGKININEANKDVLKAIYPEFTEDDLNKIMEEKNKIGGWSSEKAFVSYVTTTLGRGGFKDRYRDEKDYPFTVKSYSFLIEALGTIPKSKTVIQKKIKVAVALTSLQGVPLTKNAASSQECESDAGFYWNPNTLKCVERPFDQESCKINIGQWEPQSNGSYACVIQLDGGKALTVFPGAGNKTKEPNSLKVLYWVES